ncbi:hypothetical protein SJAG_03019 [Schizosaccharomyces japonicus yFS275]|uniref:Uncharacterized protein n=1 Tax=Schizosaccharomyces japonicus (strain yFS275 / FY16936) TaxID=402676 RepID=B6K338_SCHJY|nr:hypothetical protein SJAG_03019 [Schizosaccharomyces japonicus yFS275]EEB07895.1 hypothetical protein SJAG_03019 [Schizosaccharomyces japonicus yFS275]
MSNSSANDSSTISMTEQSSPVSSAISETRHSRTNSSAPKIETFNVLVLGNLKAKKSLVKRVFGVKYLRKKSGSSDTSLSNFLCSPQNKLFLAFCSSLNKQSLESIHEFLKKEPSVSRPVIHCIWYQVDARNTSPEELRMLQELTVYDIPIISILYNLEDLIADCSKSVNDNSSDATVVSDSKTELSSSVQACAHIHALSKISSPAHRTELVFTTCHLLDDAEYLLFVSAQRENAEAKFFASILAGLSRTNIATIGSSHPFPIPLSSFLSNTIAARLIVNDIIRIWNLDDAFNVCSKHISSWNKNPSEIIHMLGSALLTSVFMPLHLIKGIWEAPLAVKAMIVCTADACLPLERMHYYCLSGGVLTEETVMAFVQHYDKAVGCRLREYLSDTTEFNAITSFSQDVIYSEASRVIKRFRYLPRAKHEELEVPLMR